MPSRIKRLLWLLLLPCLLLAGCGEKRVELSSGSEPVDITEFTAVVTPEDLNQLGAFPQLQSADLRGSECYEEILAWAKEHPNVHVLYSVPLPDGSSIDSDNSLLDLSDFTEAQLKQVPPLLDALPAVKEIRFPLSSPMDPALLQQFLALCPDASYQYKVKLLGQVLSSDQRRLDLTGLKASQVKEVCRVLPLLPALTQVDLGDQETSPELSWKAIASLQAAQPKAAFDYRFTLYDGEFYGKDLRFSTLDETMSFSHLKLPDDGESVWEVLPCMQKLNYLDMDSCGIDNETMAAVRDKYPDVTVVWRVWFGDSYSARTDATKILASNPGIGGSLMPGTYENLKYFTKLKYLDVGHQPMLDSIFFMSYMPDLEVAIICMGCWTDPSPIADCPHLEYLEIQTSEITDLTPLSNLKELRHLNIGYDFYLTDISPIYDLDLERLWIGCLTPIPAEQVDEFQLRHPDCVVNLDGDDPHYMWRWIGIDEQGSPIRHPRYNLLVEQMGYDREEYSFEWIETRGW